VPEAPAAAAPLPGLAEATAWRGFEVDDVAGARLGRVHGVFADASDGEPAWLIVAVRQRFALLRRRRVSLVVMPLRDCAAAAGRVWTAHAGDIVRAAPTVDPTRPLLREHELTICAHYGIGKRVGRAAEILARPATSITAQPVNKDVP
jgi:hypothetical protein